MTASVTGWQDIKGVSAENPWRFFDNIYCISTETRTDRRESASLQFSHVGLLPDMEFHIVKKHPTDPEKGIYESHMACIQKGLAAGAQHIAIFEDDVFFEGLKPAILQSCVAFMTNTPHWNAFFFGCLVSGSRKTQNPNVRQIRYRSLTHAYVLHRRFAEKLAGRPWQGRAFDGELKSVTEGYFAVYPAFAFQSNSPTDNTQLLRLDRFRRWCGGLYRIQKRNEAFFRCLPVIIVLHILFIMLVTLYVFY
jgi:GR25 family glycosyltransferase involved in LPS biosynthesis